MKAIPATMATQKTERSLESLKEKLWEQFDAACRSAAGAYDPKIATMARQAVGLIGQALVDSYREERETAEAGKKPGLKG